MLFIGNTYLYTRNIPGIRILARMRQCRFAITLAICSACSGGTEPRGHPNGDRLLPAALRLTAEAFSVDANGLTVQCSIDTYITLNDRVDDETGVLVQYGEGGGDARRYRDISVDRAVSFWAHTYFENLQFHLIGADSLEIRSPESANATERFWREFALFAGNTRGANPLTGELAHGRWRCNPMDTPPSSGEYYDAEGFADGTWTLRADN